MPYLDGMKFSQAVIKARNWKGLNQVLVRKPLSSEQILHPQKYLAAEKPLAVSTTFRPRQEELYYSGVVGEYFLNVLLKNGPEIADAASGWGGDLFSLYRHGDSRLLLWEALWDSPADCARFAAAFQKFLETRFHVAFQDGQSSRPQVQRRQFRRRLFFPAPGQRPAVLRPQQRPHANQRANQRRYI